MKKKEIKEKLNEIISLFEDYKMKKLTQEDIWEIEVGRNRGFIGFRYNKAAKEWEGIISNSSNFYEDFKTYEEFKLMFLEQQLNKLQ